MTRYLRKIDVDGRSILADAAALHYYELDALGWQVFEAMQRGELPVADQGLGKIGLSGIPALSATAEDKTRSLLAQGPSMVLAHLTQACNLRCTYCYDGHGGRRRSMDDGVADAFIAWLCHFKKRRRRLSLAFFGGEPLLKFDLMKRITLAIQADAEEPHQRIRLSLQTNGTLIDQEVARFFKEHRFGVGLSVDGERASHDLNRRFVTGSGSYECVTKGMAQLATHGVRYSVRVTAADGVDIAGAYRFFARSAPYASVAISHPSAEREGDRVGEPDPGCVRRTASAVVDLGKACVGELKRDGLSKSQIYRLLQRPVDKSGDARHPYVRAAGYLLQHLNHKGPRSQPCGAGVGRVAVATDGKIYPCHRFAGLSDDAFAVGDVYEGLSNEAVANFNSLTSEAIDAQCSGCWVAPQCRGGCHWERAILGGKFGRIPDSRSPDTPQRRYGFNTRFDVEFRRALIRVS